MKTVYFQKGHREGWTKVSRFSQKLEKVAGEVCNRCGGSNALPHNGYSLCPSCIAVDVSRGLGCECPECAGIAEEEEEEFDLIALKEVLDKLDRREQGEVPVLDDSTRRQKVDGLLEILSREADPQRKEQIKQRIRSLTASLKLAAQMDGSAGPLNDLLMEGYTRVVWKKSWDACPICQARDGRTWALSDFVRGLFYDAPIFERGHVNDRCSVLVSGPNGLPDVEVWAF